MRLSLRPPARVLTALVLVFIRTSPFRVQDKQYSRSVVVPLRRPTDDTAAIRQAALAGLHSIFQAGFNDAKAGVMLLASEGTPHKHHGWTIKQYRSSPGCTNRWGELAVARAKMR